MNFIIEKEDVNSSNWAIEVSVSSRRGAIRVFAKSAEFEDYFANLGRNVERSGGSPTTKIGQVTCYNWPPSQKPSVGTTPVVWTDLDTHPLWNPVSGAVNVTWLRAVGLRDGITVNFSSPMTRTMMTTATEQIEKVLRELYEAHIAEREVTLRMKAVYEHRG